MERPAADLERRSRQYFYDDGITELAVAGLFVAIALLFLVEALAPAGSLFPSFSAIGLVVLVAGGMWIISAVVRYAKTRITYPRTGYVRYRRADRSPQRRAGAFALGAVISAGIVLLLAFTAPASDRLVGAIQGVAIGAFLAYMGYQAGVSRFYLLAAVSLVAGVGITLAGMGEIQANSAYFALMAVALAISGGWTLAGYLRSTSPVEGE